MEEIKKKAFDDEFEKAEEEIHETPRHKIPVPKVKNELNKEKKENE